MREILSMAAFLMGVMLIGAFAGWLAAVGSLWWAIAAWLVGSAIVLPCGLFIAMLLD